MSPTDLSNLKPAQRHALSALVEAVEDDRGGLVEATHAPVLAPSDEPACNCGASDGAEHDPDCDVHQVGEKPDDAIVTRVPTVALLLPSGATFRAQAPTFRAAALACLSWLTTNGDQL